MEFGGLAAPLGAMEAQVRRTLEPSVSGRDDMDDLMAQIDRREAIAWAVTDADRILSITVTELRRDGGLQCFIRHCAGSGLRTWLHYLATIEEWARWFGCDSIALEGRAGWARVLVGWKRRDRQLVKAL